MRLTENTIPSYCTVLIIGGGPAGSSAATYLAQSGIDAVVLEKSVFPRNQVGESLIPNFWKFSDLLGVSEKIQQEGFVVKSGGIFAWNGQIRQVDFSKFGHSRPGLHVERDIFDDLLLEHAQSCGATVFNQVVVKNVDFSDPLQLRVSFTDKRGEANAEGSIHCEYVIDASGHSSFLAGQLGTRQTVSSNLNFLSIWGYFNNTQYLGVDRQSHTTDYLKVIPPVTFVMSYADGWIWHIVLREKTSVGLVVHTDRTKGMNKAQREAFFKETCLAAPYLNQLLAPGEYIEGSLHYRPDYSYYSTRICSENYYCIGDAAAFVDPIFSHGVQNAFYNANISTLAIKESLKHRRNRGRYSQLCESRMQQFYGFSRALALGDYGCNGVNRALVKPLMKAMPPLELELLFLVSQVTNRSENFTQLARESGVWPDLDPDTSGQGTETIELFL
ncbi:MAG: FAD-dependent oxidoreductase [Methylococcaceae bacterium]|nr:FAD-dependent oxidoreductase [Methylococcaceae bacterium]